MTGESPYLLLVIVVAVIIILYVLVFLLACMYTTCMPGAYGSQKVALGHLGLECYML